MTTVVYVTSVEPESGQSLVALGSLDTASARSSRIGYFKPVIGAGPGLDPGIELMRTRYRLAQTYEQSFGVTTDETRGLGESVAPSLVHRILGAFESLAEMCDVIVVEGTDFTSASAAFEFALNAEIAHHLGATAVVVVRARSHDPDQVAGVLHATQGSLSERHIPILSFVVNRVLPEQWSRLARLGPQLNGVRVWLLPEEPSLYRPTLADIVGALDAKVLDGGARGLTREVSDYVIGAMTLPHVMDRVTSDSLVVVPGDRADVILMALAARFSSGLPSVAGLLLTGGYEPHPALLRFAEGVREQSVPILLTDLALYETVEIVSKVHGSLESGDARRTALALRVFEDHIDQTDLERRISLAKSEDVTPVMFERRMMARARADKQEVVLPEGSDDRILAAADRLLRRDAVSLTVLGDPESIGDRSQKLGLDLSGAEIIDPTTSALRKGFAKEILRLRRAKGMSEETARDLSCDPTWFGTMLVREGYVGGMVSGATHTTADTVRPALQIIRTAPGTSVVSSVFLMAMPNRVLVYGDCAVIPDPDERQLADIALSSARTARAFGIDPYVAMLSYSTGESGSGADVDKVANATRIVREREPDLPVDGPIQYDAAVDPAVAAAKLPGSAVAGRATVLIFPDLNTGNNTYKAVQRSAGVLAMGPVLQGLRLPVNDLSRGATVDDIVNTVIITAIQAQHSRGE